MKKILFILIISFVGIVHASTKEEKLENRKLIQVKIIGSIGSPKANAEVNEFLMSQKLTRENVIDIKITRSQEFISTMIIYEIDLDKK